MCFALFCLVLSSVSSSDPLCLVGFFLLRRSLEADRIVTPEATTVTPNHFTAEAARINSALDFFFLNTYYSIIQHKY